VIGAVAQLVEQWTENPCVGGSNPPHTTERLNFGWVFFYSLNLCLGLRQPTDAHITKRVNFGWVFFFKVTFGKSRGLKLWGYTGKTCVYPL
jgi:hypothetical protein